MREFGAFVKKEFYHILRDKRTMLIVLVMPVVLIILFGFALSTEVRNVNIAILSPSSDPTVRQIAERLDASEYFTVTQWLDRPEEIDEVMKSGEVQLVVAFGQNFSGGMLSPDGSQMQLIVDASDANMAQSYTSYASGIIAAFGNEMASGGTESGILTQVQFLYNPQMKSAYNFVPGIMGLIMMLICAMMTSISIVREKETGTMEVLLVSPVRPIYIVVSKMVPYFVLSCINLATILLLSVFVLGVPVAGSLAALWLVSLIYIIANLSLGLLISTMAQQQVIALMFSGLLLMMPTMLLSGMVFPIESMPWPLRGISCILPARWYITAVRKLMIQGLPMIYAWKEIVILASMAVVLIGASLKKLNNDTQVSARKRVQTVIPA